MKIFNVELLLKDKSFHQGSIENYGTYMKHKVIQLLLIVVIFFVLFYTLSFFSRGLDKLHNITPSALQEGK